MAKRVQDKAAGKSKNYRVAIVGATGVVGREMLRTLEERRFPVSEIRLLASERSVGEILEFGEEEIRVGLLDDKSLGGLDLALFSAGSDVSLKYAPLAAEKGCVVIDNTSAFRQDEDVPLVVPEVNAGDLAAYTQRGIIANPNCSTIQMVVALKPLHDAAGLKRVVVSTYQSVSGAGQSGVKELEQQCRDLFNMRELSVGHFGRQIAFNCLPQIDVFEADGYSREEHKMMHETRKIMHLPDLPLSATTVRIPVFYGHAEAVNVELHKPLAQAEARELLSQAPGVLLMDDPEEGQYPTPIDAAGRDETLVGRVRVDPSVPAGLDLWVVADNVRKGAALNSVQIAECLVADFL